jgi:hypothetical protein
MENSNSTSNEVKNNDESLTPNELMKMHMKDPNHVVTEDELRKMKVGADAEDNKEVAKETDAKTNELDHLPNNDDLPNPFSILGS